MQNGVYPMTVSLTSLVFDEAGSGEKSAFAFAALFAVKDGQCALSYQSGEGENSSLTELAFREDEPLTVRMRRRGDTVTEVTYAPGHTDRALYRIPGVGELDMETKTARVENSLSPAGGRLLLDYEMLIGGARQRLRLTLEAKLK